MRQARARDDINTMLVTKLLLHRSRSDCRSSAQVTALGAMESEMAKSRTSAPAAAATAWEQT